MGPTMGAWRMCTLVIDRGTDAVDEFACHTKGLWSALRASAMPFAHRGCARLQLTLRVDHERFKSYRP